MSRKTKEFLQKLGITLTAFILALSITANVIAHENAYQINGALGIETFRIEQNENSDEDTNYFPSAFNSVAEVKQAGLDLCEEIEAEGAVLLKNENNALPLNVAGGENKISLIGISSVDMLYGGTGSSGIDTSSAPTMKSSFENAGFSVNSALLDFYTANMDGNTRYYKSGGYKPDDVCEFGVNDIHWDEVSAAVSGSFQQYGDAAIVTFSRTAGEGADMPFVTGKSAVKLLDEDMDGNYLALNENERSLLRGLAAEKGTTFKKIIVLLNSGNAMEAEFINDPEYKIDAVLWIGTPGQTGLNAVANIIAGKINPSGSLVDTFYNSNKYNPVIVNFGNNRYLNSDQFGINGRVLGNLDRYVVYQEGIYLGYRYTETRYEDKVMGTANVGDFDYDTVVGYPFGYGLSYTSFEYSNFNVTEHDGNYTVSVTVKNTGSVPGKEPVQIYVQKPYTDYDKANGVEKASVELVGYGKTRILQPNETQEITVEVDGKYLASFDANGAKTYIIDAGDYYFTVATDSHNAVNNILAAKGYTTADGMTENGNSVLTWKTTKNFDSETYSVSSTGMEITALFDHANLNKYDGNGGQSVTYMSRSDWNGTYPTIAPVLTMTQKMVDDMMYDIQPDNVAYPTYGADNGLQLIDLRVDENGEKIPYDDPRWDMFLDQLTWDETVDMVRQGQRSTAALTRLGKVQSLDHNGCVGVTQVYNAGENGLAAKTNDPNGNLAGTCFPATGIWAATMNDELMERTGDIMGEDGLWAGYSGLYGFGLNIHRSPYSGRNFEYYSEDAFLSGSINKQNVLGIQKHGIYVYNKHFALNDQESNRAGVGVWANEQTIREIYLRAFEIPIVEADAKNTMTCFSRFGVSLATTDYNLITAWARGECGLSGFHVTDTWRAISAYTPIYGILMAGVDLPDGTDDAENFAPYSGAEGNYGALAQRMREAVHKIMYTTVHSNLMNGVSSGVRYVAVTPWWSILLDTLSVVSCIGLVACCAWTILSYTSSKKKH